MEDILLPTQQQRAGIGLIFRHTFGSSPTSPSVAVSVRYNRSRFEIDRAEADEVMVDIDVPNVDYAFFDPGVSFRIGVTPAISVSAEGRFLAVTEAGEIQQANEYGASKIFGFEADICGEYQVNRRVFARLGARAMGFSFDFNPDPAVAVSDRLDRDGDGTQDVGGAFDRYLGGYLAIGALF
jgi:hypothetical protein